jgi:hypothetical protein
MVDRLPEPFRGGEGRTAREVETGGNVGLYVLIFLAIVGAGVLISEAVGLLKAALAGLGQ